MKLVRIAWIALAVLSVSGVARADSTQDRLDRLEHDLNQLQRQVYRSEVGSVPPSAAPKAPELGSGTQALDVQIRMDQIEAQMRTLTGQLEEIQYNISQVSGRLDKMQADNEVRFQALEGAGAGAPAVPAGTAPAAAAPAIKGRKPGPPIGPNRGAGNMDEAPSTGGTLAAPGDEPPDSSDRSLNDSAPATPSGLPSGTAQEQYNYAFGQLRQADYKGAEASFKLFIQKHGSDPLAANAQYWLGETYFVRGDYAAASSAFADGYQKYPQGPKAPDNLLKLGISLGNQGRKQDACFAFARLERDFPTAGPAVKDRLASEKKHYGC